MPTALPEKSQRPPRRGVRFSVPAVLFLFVCASAGMTAFVRPPLPEDPASIRYYATQGGLLNALVSVSAVAAIVALLDQRRRIRQEAATAGARGVRLALSLLLALTLIAELLAIRRILPLPESETWYGSAYASFSECVWWLAALAAIVCLAGRTSGGDSRRPLWHVALAFVLAGVFIAASLPELTSITYLVHIATAGIEAWRPYAYQRQDAFPDHAREGFFTYRMAVAALVVLLASVGSMLIALRGRAARPVRHALAALASVGFAYCAAYAVWYYSSELPRVSPDIAGATPLATPVELAGGALLALAVCFWLAYRASTKTSGHSIPIATRAGWLGRTPAAVAAAGAIAAGAYSLVTSVIAIVDHSVNPTMFVPGGFWRRLGDAVGFYVSMPSSLLMVAMLFAGVDLARRVWKSERAEVPIVNVRQMLLTAALFAFIAAIAAPTLAAYSFCSWLGPWYR